MNQKKGLPDQIGSAKRNSPRFEKIGGRCETRPPSVPSDSPRAISAIFSKLGKVMMGMKKQKNIFKKPKSSSG